MVLDRYLNEEQLGKVKWIHLLKAKVFYRHVLYCFRNSFTLERTAFGCYFYFTLDKYLNLENSKILFANDLNQQLPFRGVTKLYFTHHSLCGLSQKSLHSAFSAYSFGKLVFCVNPLFKFFAYSVSRSMILHKLYKIFKIIVCMVGAFILTY